MGLGGNVVDNLPWTFTESNRIVDAKNCTVADCRYTANQGRNIVDTVNAHAKLESRNAKLVAALKGLLEATPQEECESGCDTDNCPWMQARAVLKEVGE